MRKMICLFIPLVTSALFGDIRIEKSASIVEQYDYVEFTLHHDNTDIQNPFLDAMVSAVVEGPQNRATKITGFCDSDDGSIYKLRYMPDQPGEYSVNIRFVVNGKNIQFMEKFKAIPSDRNGLLRVDEDYPYHFIWEGSGKHFFWNGTTAYWLLGWNHLGRIYTIIDRYDKFGINKIRMALSARAIDGSRWFAPQVVNSDEFNMQLNPWIAMNPALFDNPEFDVNRFNVDFWKKCEKTIEYARDRDIVVSVIFYVDQGEGFADPFGIKNEGCQEEKNYYSYVVSRLSAYSNVIWDLCNEYRLQRSDEWAEQMGWYVKEIDPYNHLTSVHGFPYFMFRQSEWADFALFQEWDNAGGFNFMLANRQLQAYTGRIIPQVNEEFGYEDIYPEFTFDKINAPGRNADTRRRLAWRIFMTGSYCSTGESSDYGGGWINGYRTGESEMLDGHKVIRQIFEQLEWWKMEPVLDVINHGGYCLAEKGRQYLAYVVWGYIKMDLVPGKYEASVYDAKTGKLIEVDKITGDSFEKKFDDWKTDYAIIVKKMD